jgi:anionic cell wall polymer biosynthesis LytR-Cps2A-Psr (LCP) family protein
MNDWLLIGIFLLFTLIIIYLLYERSSFFTQFKDDKEKLMEENSRLVKAVISKNANDYVMAAAIDKVPAEEKKESDEFVPEENLSDEEFESALGIRRTPPKQ